VYDDMGVAEAAVVRAKALNAKGTKEAKFRKGVLSRLPGCFISKGKSERLEA
jgi:hypothetical protein